MGLFNKRQEIRREGVYEATGYILDQDDVRKSTRYVLSKNVKEIGRHIYINGDISEEYIYVDKKNKCFKEIDGNLYTKDGKTLIRYAAGKMSESFEVPEGVTEIGDGAFCGCIWLKYVKLPVGLKKIGVCVFALCKGLKEIEIPEGVSEIGNWSFNWCERLEKVNIPSGIKIIRAGLFCECGRLEKIEIPDSVERIEEQAFLRCKSLKDLKIGSGLEIIEFAAFEGCHSLEEITLNHGLKALCKRAFAFCGLIDVKIPKSVIRIEDEAFLGNKQLSSFYIGDSLVHMGAYVFYESSCTVYCGEKDQPRDWSGKWLTGSDCEVIWGYERKGKSEA